MRVGVYIGDHLPSSGGGYTFVSSILKSFLDLNISEHTFVIIGDCDAIDSCQNFLGSNYAFEFERVPELSFIEKVGIRLRRFSGLAEHLFGGVSVWDRMVTRRALDIMWFVGGGAYEPPPCPYIATVWDIQHRTHPWFPEVSGRGEWVSREYSLKKFLARATFVVTGTKTGAEQLERFFQVPASVVRLLPHPTPDFSTEESELSPAFSEISILLSQRYIFYPAQFWAHKNHINLLHALKFLRESHSVVMDLVLCGSDKGNEQHIKDCVVRLGLTGQVHFLGFISIKEMVLLYRNAFALIYPSFSGPENLPPLEAFSLNCPVVVADYDGAREQLGDAAIYFDPRDPEDISDCILSLMEHDGLRGELVERGVQRALQWMPRDYLNSIVGIVSEFESVRRCWQ